MPAINAKNISQYIDKSQQKINLTDQKALKRCDAFLLIWDGMSVMPAVKKIDIEYNKQYKNKLSNLAGYLDDIFGQTTFDEQKSKIQVGEITLNFKPGKPPGEKRDNTPTDMQEKGTVDIFNSVLDRNKPYPTIASMKTDGVLMKQLEKTFSSKGNHTDKINDWLLTYFEQQEKFYFHKKFGHYSWSTFKYGNESFVDFFRTRIKLFQNQEGDLVKKYEEWNPSDIWAAKNLSGMQREIKEAFEIDMKQKRKSPPQVSKLNNLLIQYMNDDKLVGISLKKIEKPASSHIELFNITPKLSKISQVVVYKWNDLDFEIKNIAKDTLVTTYVRYKQSHTMNINLGEKRKFGNLSFNTQIKGSSAQGGQAPVAFVLSLLHSQGSEKDFMNDHNKVAHDILQYKEERKEWEKRYEFLLKQSKISGLIPWAKFDKYIRDLYFDNQEPVAVAKLMLIHFYYEAFKNYPNNEQFWISLLHLGMKVGSRWPPHAKISD